MTNVNEIEALQASFKGALATTESLVVLRESVEGLHAGREPSAGELEALSRVTLAHAIAAQALRGFVESMVHRRSAAGA